METKKQDWSLSDLFAQLSRELITLIRQELEFAKTEVTHNVSKRGRDIIMLALGAAIAYAGLLALVGAAIVGLGRVMPLSLSALIVGLIVAALGYILIQNGLSKLKREGMVPRQTLESVKEDKEWLKKQVT